MIIIVNNIDKRYIFRRSDNNYQLKQVNISVKSNHSVSKAVFSFKFLIIKHSLQILFSIYSDETILCAFWLKYFNCHEALNDFRV